MNGSRGEELISKAIDLDIRCRGEGILLGLAAGDQIGGPTRMAVRVAESLAARVAFDPDDILSRYLEWWIGDGFDTGPTAEAAFELISSGKTVDEATREVDRKAGGLTAGCNPAHRSAALALCAFLADESLAEAAMTEARLTHYHPLAGDVAAASVRICRALLTGKTWQKALIFAADNRMVATQAAFEPVTEQQLSKGGYAPDVLQAALWFVGQSNNLENALQRSIQFAGYSNYCPVLVGSIGGARWGVGSLKPEWFQHQGDMVERLRAAARALNFDCY